MKTMLKLLLCSALAAVVPAAAGAQDTPAGSTTPTDIVSVRGDHPGPKYDRRLFGQFAEHLGTGIYGGIWVGPGSKIPNVRGYRTDVLDALMFGIGNELWGCGGNMLPEYAADETRKFATFVKTPKGVPIMKIASGANSEDYNWTDVMMRKAGTMIQGIGVHYYTVPGPWEHKGPATGFDEDAWANTLVKTMRMDELLEGHSRIMDKYDPKKKVALLVDEWGTWYDQEPGSHPGFLYQQNSLRDAVVASLNLDIFAKYADRVRGANIAQMVNVLQAMILTDGSRMLRTPTYWVFDMYKDYQDGTVLPVEIASHWYKRGTYQLRAVSGSAVRGTDGVVHVGLTNVDPNQPANVTVQLAGIAGRTVSGRILTGPTIDAHNTFDAPDAVRPVAFTGATLAANGMLSVTLPAKSVVMLDVR